MAFVPAKCTSCGASLTVDNSKDAAICEFCGTPFIVEKAINNYNITNNINAQVVNVYTSIRDFDIRGGRLHKYNGKSQEVVIPNSVTSISSHAFSHTSITKLTIPGTVRKVGSLVGNYEEEFDVPLAKSLKTVIIEDGVQELEISFDRCGVLESVSLPPSLKKIGKYTFCECASLRSITIPAGVTEIGEMAFNDCKNLSSISLPDCLTVIGEDAFSGCVNLELVELGTGLLDIEGGAFGGCIKLSSVFVRNHPREDNCYIFPDKFRIIHGWVFTHVPSKVVFLCTDTLERVETNTYNDQYPFIYRPNAAGDIKVLHMGHECPDVKCMSSDFRPELWDQRNWFVSRTPSLTVGCIDGRSESQIEQEKREQEERKRQLWMKCGLCAYCGGSFRKLGPKKCKECGRYKDYYI